MSICRRTMEDTREEVDQETEERRRDLITREIQHAISMEVDLSPPDIKEDARLVEDLGVDELCLCELVLNLEDKYALDIEDEDMYGWRTVRDVIDYIFKRVHG